ncbi:MAG TPA: hypothetical protein VGJ03_13750 [Acidimicrobiales bacterium]|jgi:hypothetical protein
MTLDRTRATDDHGVEGNTRLTATNAAIIFVLLAIEGVTVLRVASMLRLHVFIGLVLVPPVLLKIGTTTYRAARYYLGSASYRRRGPPPAILRALGPFVVILTLAVLATGVELLVLGPAQRSPWLTLHKISFILWFVAMTVHVLGHIAETAQVAPLDWQRHPASRVRGAGVRRVMIVITVMAGLALALIYQPVVTDWLSHPAG